VAKFTVIAGGSRGREPPGVLQARNHFRQLVVELLRAIARGDDYESRVTRELLEFTIGMLPTGESLCNFDVV
jgi:hypothetical protein